MISLPLRPWTALFAAAVVLTGCNTVPSSEPAASDASTTAAPAPVPKGAAAAPAPKAAPAPAPAAKEGDVVGKPAPNSKFNQVKIGMGMKQVTDLIGQPTDQGAYVTGKAWIPFYFGPDRYRHELLYKGQGRLVFSAGGVGNLSSGRLSRIIHKAEETGYR